MILILLFPGAVRYDRETRSIDLTKAWRRAIREAKIEDFRFHDLRHSAASYLAMGGATLVEIAEVLGHKTFAMVKRYSHLSAPHTSRVVEKMTDKIFGSGEMEKGETSM